MMIDGEKDDFIYPGLPPDLIGPGGLFGEEEVGPGPGANPTPLVDTPWGAPDLPMDLIGGPMMPLGDPMAAFDAMSHFCEDLF